MRSTCIELAPRLLSFVKCWGPSTFGPRSTISKTRLQKGSRVAEEAAKDTAKKDEGKGAAAAGGKPVILYALIVLNMLFVGGVGMILYSSKKKEKETATAVDKAAEGLVKEGKEGGHEGGKGEKDEHEKEAEEYIGEMIPLETFLVNLSGNRGNKLLKLNMELEVEGTNIAKEIDKRKPQIRDIIIILLSSKTYAQMSSPEGKEYLREEIRDTVNSFLTSGKIKRVHFTEFIFN